MRSQEEIKSDMFRAAQARTKEDILADFTTLANAQPIKDIYKETIDKYEFVVEKLIAFGMKQGRNTSFSYYISLFLLGTTIRYSQNWWYLLGLIPISVILYFQYKINEELKSMKQ